MAHFLAVPSGLLLDSAAAACKVQSQVECLDFAACTVAVACSVLAACLGFVLAGRFAAVVYLDLACLAAAVFVRVGHLALAACFVSL